MAERTDHTTYPPTPGHWPPNVVARYVTIASTVDPEATVDITATATTRQDDVLDVEVMDVTLMARCRGCRATFNTRLGGLTPNNPPGALLDTDYGHETREWAQEHADRCRALPRPGVIG